MSKSNLKLQWSTALLLVLAGAGQAEQSLLQTFGSGADQFTIEFVTIGNPGNTADSSGAPNPAGSVAYTYNLGKYEVSRDMIDKANTAGGLGITMADMSTYVGGNFANRAAAGISWNEAARFVNYLNTSKGYQAAYNFTTSGSNDNITLWGAGQYSGSNRFRHKDAVFVLPSLDEWYKGAYGSSGGTWYDFATGSNSRNSGPVYTDPVKVTSGTAAGTAVYGQSLLQGPADVTLAGGLSPYGTMGQGGNVWEWSETAFDGVNDSAGEGREFRGGSWMSSWEEMESLSRIPFANGTTQGGSTTAQNDYGFRVAMVPEPSALSLLMIGCAGLVAFQRRRTS